MADNKVLISFEADSTKAIGEVSRLVSVFSSLPEKFERLNETLSKVNTSVTSLNRRLTSTAKSAEAAGIGVSSATKSMRSLANASTSASASMSKFSGAGIANVNSTAKAFTGASAAASKLTTTVPTSATATKTATQTMLSSATAMARGFYAAFSAVVSTVSKVSNVMGGGIPNAFGSANTVLSTFRTNIVSGLSNAGSSLDKFFIGVKKGSMVFLSFNDSIRVAAQGITNLGRAMFFFFTIPVLGFVTGVSRAIIDFDDALVRVQKTTNVTDAELSTLTQHLRNLATITKSSHVELARTAEKIGQLGVSSIPAIVNLVQIFELFGTAVDMTSDDVAIALGKIANAFGWNLNSSSDEVFRLANVINMLENTTAASAAEIITTMGKWAQAGHMLEVTAWQAASLSASMISLGLSEEEAGTALKRVSTQLIAKADAVAEVMGANERYKDSMSVVNAINESAVDVWLDIATAAKKAASENGENAQALLALINIADERGGRALGALASNINMVTDNLEAARVEWERATSLITEYERAMTSTKSQMALFKNNINDIGVSLGDTLLPVVNRFISIAIPGLKEINKAFAALSDKQKILLIAFGAGLIVLGPLIMLVGQLVHGFNLIFMGVGIFIKSLASVGAIIPVITALLSGLVSVALSWPVVIGAAVVAVLKILSMMGVNIAGVFESIASLAKQWGQALMDTYATGLAAGLNTVLQVISMIASLIAGFFEAHSPPKEGPLSTIDKWGSALLKTYLAGFNNADFGVLESVGKKIEKLLTRGKEGDTLTEGLANYAKARIQISSLISKFNETGLVDEGLLSSALDGLGEMSDEMETLIRLQLKYNTLQKQLDDIEKARKGLLSSYDAEIEKIGASNSAAEDKVSLIRNAMRGRDKELRSLAIQEDSLEAQSETAKENLDWQTQMIDAMMEQDDIFGSIADALERMSKSLGGMADALDGFELPTGGLSVDTEGIAAASEEIQAFIKSLGEGELIFQGLKDGFAGMPALTRDAFTTDEGYNYYTMLYDVGTRAGEIKTNIDNLVTSSGSLATSISDFMSRLEDFDLQAFIDSDPMIRQMIENFNELAASVTTAFGSFETAKTTVDNTLGQMGTTFSGFWDQYVQPLVDDIMASPFVQELIRWFPVLTSELQAFGASFSPFIEPILAGLQNIQDASGPLLTSLQNLWTAMQPVLSLLGGIIAGGLALAFGFVKLMGSAVLGALGGLLGALITGGTMVVSGMISVVTGIINIISGVLGLVFNVITALFTGSWDKVRDSFLTLVDGVGQILGGLLLTVVGAFVAIGGGILKAVEGFITGVIVFFTNLYNALIGNSIVPDMLSEMMASFTLWFGNISTKIVETIKEWIATFASNAGAFLKNGADLIEKFKTGMFEKFAQIKPALIEKMKAIKDWFAGKVSEYVQIGKDLIGGLIKGIDDSIGALKDAIRAAIEAAIKKAKEVLGIKPTSTVFAEVDAMPAVTYIKGVSAETTKYASAIGTNLGSVPTYPATASLTNNMVTSENNIGGQINLHFGKDSVRSDKDIKDITDAVIDALNRRARGRYSLGYTGGNR